MANCMFGSRQGKQVTNSPGKAQTSNLVELDCSLEKVLDDHEFSVTAIAWSPDDKLLLSSAHHEVKLWDVEVKALS